MPFSIGGLYREGQILRRHGETEVSETRDLDKNTLIDLDREGQICAIIVEHASIRADIPHFSFEQNLLRIWQKLDLA